MFFIWPIWKGWKSNTNVIKLSWFENFQISEHSSPSLLVTLDNRRLGVMMTSSALRIQHTTEAGKWNSLSEAEVEEVLEEGALEAIAAMIQKGLAEQLVDFDNHLDDVAKDFLNVDLNMEIDQCL